MLERRRQWLSVDDLDESPASGNGLVRRGLDIDREPQLLHARELDVAEALHDILAGND